MTPIYNSHHSQFSHGISLLLGPPMKTQNGNLQFASFRSFHRYLNSSNLYHLWSDLGENLMEIIQLYKSHHFASFRIFFAVFSHHYFDPDRCMKNPDPDCPQPSHSGWYLLFSAWACLQGAAWVLVMDFEQRQIKVGVPQQCRTPGTSWNFKFWIKVGVPQQKVEPLEHPGTSSFGTTKHNYP